MLLVLICVVNTYIKYNELSVHCLFTYLFVCLFNEAVSKQAVHHW